MIEENAVAVEQVQAEGLTDEILLTAVRRGELLRDSATLNDPPILPGIVAWGGTVRALRDLLVPSGWQRNDERNFSTVVSPSGAVAIAVSSGNENTGLADRHPQPKRPKGDATVCAVQCNQLELFPNENKEAPAKGRITWFVLVHRVDGEELVRCELSLPELMSPKGIITKWKTRHILKPIELDPTPHHGRGDYDAGDELDVEVVRNK